MCVSLLHVLSVPATYLLHPDQYGKERRPHEGVTQHHLQPLTADQAKSQHLNKSSDSRWWGRECYLTCG